MGGVLMAYNRDHNLPHVANFFFWRMRNVPRNVRRKTAQKTPPLTDSGPLKVCRESFYAEETQIGWERVLTSPPKSPARGETSLARSLA